MTKPRLIIICGVSACGKSTIGRALSDHLSCQFLEGDDYHPPENIDKMSSGIPLTDQDRSGWIEMICKDVNTSQDSTLILSCSALTEFVQEKLQSDISRELIWVKLHITRKEAQRRMISRDHFMPPALLDSQFRAWSPPQGGIDIISVQEKTVILKKITAYLDQNR